METLGTKRTKKRKPRRGKQVADYYRKYHYGMPHGTYDTMFATQEGKCAICFKEQKLVVDHCHSTKRIRGLLCNSCNLGLGKFEDSPELLRSAINYLEIHSNATVN